MPQLPGGRHVGVSLDHLLDWARNEAHSGHALRFFMDHGVAEDLVPSIEVVYFLAEGRNAPPPEGQAELAGFTVGALDESICDWTAAEKEYFREWLAGDAARNWLQAAFDDVTRELESKPLPEILRGILDDV